MNESGRIDDIGTAWHWHGMAWLVPPCIVWDNDNTDTNSNSNTNTAIRQTLDFLSVFRWTLDTLVFWLDGWIGGVGFCFGFCDEALRGWE